MFVMAQISFVISLVDSFSCAEVNHHHFSMFQTFVFKASFSSVIIHVFKVSTLFNCPIFFRSRYFMWWICSSSYIPAKIVLFSRKTSRLIHKQLFWELSIFLYQILADTKRDFLIFTFSRFRRFCKINDHYGKTCITFDCFDVGPSNSVWRLVRAIVNTCLGFKRFSS